MKRKISQGRKGVSLLEVVIVMAISAMMIAVVFQWLSVRKRTQFTTDMNVLLGDIKGIQTATLANEGPKPNDTPVSPCTQILPTDEIVGQAIYFDKQAPTKYTKYKLRTPANGSAVTCYESSDINLPASVGYDISQGNANPDRAFIVFVRSTNQAYYWPDNPLGNQNNPLSISDFNEASQNNGQPVVLHFQDLNDSRFKAQLKFSLKDNKVDLSYQ